jgi:predicted DNA-binding antitoxin AbrB/MazE fold protein
MMAGWMIPAVYEKGVFRPLKQPDGLIEHQRVRVYVVIEDEEDTWPPQRPASFAERKKLVRENLGVFGARDPELLRWLAEEVSLFDTGA